MKLLYTGASGFFGNEIREIPSRPSRYATELHTVGKAYVAPRTTQEEPKEHDRHPMTVMDNLQIL